MKLFKRFGCGCTGILLEDGRTITLEYCGDSDQALQVRLPSRNIREENIANAIDLSDEDHVRILESLNRLVLLGYRCIDIQNALGIRISP